MTGPRPGLVSGSRAITALRAAGLPALLHLLTIPLAFGRGVLLVREWPPRRPALVDGQAWLSGAVASVDDFTPRALR